MGEITIPAVGPDGALRPVEKMEAHRRGVLHLAISAFVFDGERLLLQRRALGKYHCGGLWANTVCTHPHWGESLEACAARRLREELGLCVPLSRGETVEYRAEVGDGLIEHERVTLFRGEARAPALRLDPAEVAETRWVTLDALRREAEARPERFTPWLRIYLGRWAALGLAAAE